MLTETSVAASYCCSTTSSIGSTAKALGAPISARAPRKAATLFIPKRDHRIDFHCAPRRKIAGQRGGRDQNANDAAIGRDVRASDVVQHRCNKTGETDRSEDADHDACNHQGKA